MHITVFQLGALGTNCYIVTDEETKSCAIVDPGASGEALINWLDGDGLWPQYVLLTHGHYDHVGGVAALRDRYEGIPVYVHEADTHLSRELSMGLQWTHHYGEGDTLTMDGITFRVLHTPGHTPGSVCLQAEDVLLTGDTLFAGSCGRTDFPGGSWSQMMDSLIRLSKLDGDFRILPGHMEDSTLERERKHNPYMKEATKR